MNKIGLYFWSKLLRFELCCDGLFNEGNFSALFYWERCYFSFVMAVIPRIVRTEDNLTFEEFGESEISKQFKKATV